MTIDRRGSRWGAGNSDRIILVSGHFSPSEYTGSIRPTRLVKYLQRAGARVVAVSIDEEVGPHAIAVAGGTDLEVFRVQKHRVLPFINDTGVHGLLPVAKKVLELLEREKPDFVYISGSPFFLFNVAFLRFHRSAIGVRWIIEYRDPWSLDKRKVSSLKDSVFRAVGWVNEIALTFLVDGIVFISRTMKDDHIKGMPWFARRSIARKAILSSTGYDPDDFLVEGTQADQELLEPGMFHFGNIDEEMRPDRLARALCLMAEPVKIHLYGRQNEALVRNLDRSTGAMVVDHGATSQREAVRGMKRAQYLLLLGSVEKQRLHRKVFEYLASGRPVVYIGNGLSETARVLERCGGALLISEEEPKRIADILDDVARGNGEFSERRPDVLHNYSKESIVGRLVSDIHRVCSDGA